MSVYIILSLSKFFLLMVQGLIGMLAKLASGSRIATKTLFGLNISRILKDILSSYDLLHGIPLPGMIDGNCDQVGPTLL